MGVIIMCASCIGSSFTFPFRISVWKGPMCTLSFNSTTTLISSMLSSSQPPTTPSCKVSSTPPLCDNNWAGCIVAHGVARWSNSLSLMMLMILFSVQVPSTKGTQLKWPRILHLRHTLPPPSPVASRSRIQKDACIGLLFPPGLLDDLPASPMGEPDNLKHLQTLALLYLPGFHYQPTPQLHVPLGWHPLWSLARSISLWAQIW